MRARESWQTKRQVAASIQRMPVPVAAPIAADAVPGKAIWEEANGSPCESAARYYARHAIAQKNDFESKEFKR